ncbi:Uncharacterized protein Adt_14564 [Abeliophyllum distichum]|uniref:Uncharacterized protein n=1 Tax=Abeliophyllum distichum TaxID=126358 RepID=A0ABD1U005_9LAMI
MLRTQGGILETFDPDIELTFRRRSKEHNQKQKAQKQIQMADVQIRREIEQQATRVAAMEASRLAAQQIQQHEEEEEDDDDDGNMPMAQFLTLAAAPDRSSIVYPSFGRNNFQLRADLINLFSNHLQFYGKATENPNTHLFRFLPKVAKMKLEISTFQQLEGKRLSPQSKSIVDSSANGSIANKNVNKACDLYELIVNTQIMFSSDRTIPRKVAGIHEIDGLSATNAQLATLTKQVELLVRTQMQGVNAIQATIMCENCGANHSTSDCMLLASPEQVNFVQNNSHQQYNPYSQTYNPGWK